MRQILLVILFLTTQFAFSQNAYKDTIETNKIEKDTIDGVYIPKNIEDCFKQINSFWDDSTKTQIKNSSEDKFSANAHFGFGMWMRNNWRLWGGSRLSKYFNDLGIYHPDDMSGIILDSYHRYLTGREINLDEQVEYYKAYWKVNEEPSKDSYPKGVEKIEFNTKMGYTLEANNYPGNIHVQTNSKTNKIWIYDYHFGWLQITEQKLKELDNPDTREETLKKIFNKK